MEHGMLEEMLSQNILSDFSCVLIYSDCLSERVSLEIKLNECTKMEELNRP